MSPQKSSSRCMALYLQCHAPRLPPDGSGKRDDDRRNGWIAIWQADNLLCVSLPISPNYLGRHAVDPQSLPHMILLHLLQGTVATCMIVA